MTGWDDLRERLTRAAKVLDGQAVEASDDREKRRLRGKAEGVRLALSYMEDGDRLMPLPENSSADEVFPLDVRHEDYGYG